MSNSRLEKIYAVANARDAQLQNEFDAVMQEHNELCAKCSELAGRVQELVDVANACVFNHIDIGHKSSTRLQSICHSKCTNDFLTDGVHHGIGFYYNGYDNKTNIIGIGKEGGDCCRYEYIYIDTHGCVEYDAHKQRFQKTTIEAYKNENDLIRTLLGGFDAFEKRFYDFIDAL